MSDKFNLQHLKKFCMVYNTIINHFNLPYTEYELSNINGKVILKRLLKENNVLKMPTKIPKEIKNELIELDNIFLLIPPLGFTLDQMKITNAVYKSLIKKSIMPSFVAERKKMSFPEFMKRNQVYNQWISKNKS